MRNRSGRLVWKRRSWRVYPRSATLAALLLAMILALSSQGALAAPPSANQVEPKAGTWRTYLLSSGSQLRRAPPPNARETAAELRQLHQLAAKRDAAALDQIAFWNTGGPIYRWNQIALNMALKYNTNTPFGARAMSLLNVAIYDALVATWDSKYAYNRPRPSTVDRRLTTIGDIPDSPSYPAELPAVTGAASAVLTYLFPKEAEFLAQQAAAAGQSQLLAGTQYPSDVAAGLALGQEVGALAVARGKADGSSAPWTGSIPTEPGHWTGTNPILPTGGTWKTWILRAGNEIRPGPPPAYDSVQMATEMAEVRNFVRTPKSNADANFWEFGAGGTRGYWYWTEQTTRKIWEYGLDANPPRAARVYALESMVYYDSFVSCWDAKYTYWGMRPFQVDPMFKPLFTTPNHPSYPSAHGCLSSGAAAILGWLFPRDAAGLNALADEIGESRIWAGIHFRSDVVVGKVIGRTVAWKAVERTQPDGAD